MSFGMLTAILLLLLLQKAENAEGQTPAIGPDGEVRPQRPPGRELSCGAAGLHEVQLSTGGAALDPAPLRAPGGEEGGHRAAQMGPRAFRGAMRGCRHPGDAMGALQRLR